jgi:hypothetical protein
MNRDFDNYEVNLIDEPTYSRNSTDNLRRYVHEYCRSDEYQHISAHGISVTENEDLLASVVLLGVGGATGVNENSMAYDGSSIYVAAGDALFSLSMPHLELNWAKRVDFATCFGVFWLEDRNCLLTWGELEIGCHTKTGEKLWSTYGPNIFTEGLELDNDVAKVTDFDGVAHKIRLSDGEILDANT